MEVVRHLCSRGYTCYLGGSYLYKNVFKEGTPNDIDLYVHHVDEEKKTYFDSTYSQLCRLYDETGDDLPEECGNTTVKDDYRADSTMRAWRMHGWTGDLSLNIICDLKNYILPRVEETKMMNRLVLGYTSGLADLLVHLTPDGDAEYIFGKRFIKLCMENTSNWNRPKERDYLQQVGLYTKEIPTKTFTVDIPVLRAPKWINIPFPPPEVNIEANFAIREG